jgi:FlaA1/EpsC-like NDP-sugar epimerase
LINNFKLYTQSLLVKRKMDDIRAIQRLKSLGRHFPQAPKEDENKPIRVAVTGAAGAIGSVLCFFIAQGRMFGPY